MLPYMYNSHYNTYSELPVQQQQHMQQQQAATTTAYGHYDNAFLQDLSRQLANVSSSLRRRHSRGAAINHYQQRTPGSAMRIVKPSSANNSPRCAMPYRNRMYAADDAINFMAPQQLQQVTPVLDLHAYQLAQQQQQQQQQQFARVLPVSRPARPVSWHPGSNLAVPNSSQFSVPLAMQLQLQAQAQAAALAAYATPSTASVLDMEPSYPTTQQQQQPPQQQSFTLSPAVYSCQTSPSTAFSPYCGGAIDTGDANAQQYYSPNPWSLSPSINTNGVMFDKLPSPVMDCPPLVPVSLSATQVLYPQQPQPQQHTAQLASQTTSHGLPVIDTSVAGWNTMLAAPPTPPDSSNCFVVATVQPAHSVVPLVEEDDSDDEVLVGMGLYDPPEKAVTDLTLQSYRSSVAQHMLGGAVPYPEPTGKGLKLEDAWEPPENLDDDDDDNNEDDPDANDDTNDAEGEEQ